MAVPVSRVLASHTRLLAPMSQLTAVVSKVATPARPGNIDFGTASANDGMLILLLCYTSFRVRGYLHLAFVAPAPTAGGKVLTAPNARVIFFFNVLMMIHLGTPALPRSLFHNQSLPRQTTTATLLLSSFLLREE